MNSSLNRRGSIISCIRERPAENSVKDEYAKQANAEKENVKAESKAPNTEKKNEKGKSKEQKCLNNERENTKTGMQPLRAHPCFFGLRAMGAL